MSAPATPRARPSVVDAAADAMTLAGRRLFPFRFERWLALGFVAFLDQCGRRGGGPPTNIGRSFDSSSGRGAPDVHAIASWAGSHVGLLVGLTLGALAVIILVTALVLWINCRGVFMYIDDVASGRADIARPWREHADLAGSLFAWRFGLGLLMLVLVLVAGAAFVLIFLGGRGSFGLGRLLAAGVVGLMVLAVAFVAALVSVGLRDFVAPLQWRLRLPCAAAARLVGGLVAAHPGTFAVYLVLKIVLAVALGIVTAVLCCFTCCLAILPVVYQTLAQPVFYFERAWSLLLLEQLGYDLVSPEEPPPVVPSVTMATP